MVRPVVAYALTAVVLLVQTGLPLHLHYCKGVLESISVFVTSGCDDHVEMASLSDCCKKALEGTCTREGGDCCDDETKLLLQDINSLLPHFYKWVIAVDGFNMTSPTEEIAFAQNNSRISTIGEREENGPPLYILLNSLIYYG